MGFKQVHQFSRNWFAIRIVSNRICKVVNTLNSKTWFNFLHDVTSWFFFKNFPARGCDIVLWGCDIFYGYVNLPFRSSGLHSPVDRDSTLLSTAFKVLWFNFLLNVSWEVLKGESWLKDRTDSHDYRFQQKCDMKLWNILQRQLIFCDRKWVCVFSLVHLYLHSGTFLLKLRELYMTDNVLRT